MVRGHGGVRALLPAAGGALHRGVALAEGGERGGVVGVVQRGVPHRDPPPRELLPGHAEGLGGEGAGAQELVVGGGARGSSSSRSRGGDPGGLEPWETMTGLPDVGTLGSPGPIELGVGEGETLHGGVVGHGTVPDPFHGEGAFGVGGGGAPGAGLERGVEVGGGVGEEAWGGGELGLGVDTTELALADELEDGAGAVVAFVTLGGVVGASLSWGWGEGSWGGGVGAGGCAGRGRRDPDPTPPPPPLGSPLRDPLRWGVPAEGCSRRRSVRGLVRLLRGRRCHSVPDVRGKHGAGRAGGGGGDVAPGRR